MAKFNADVIIVDEAQFLNEWQVIQLRDIVSKYNIPVLCYGLRTDFKGKLFEGSKALFELADEIQEIPSICDCGEKAIINARFDTAGHIIIDGDVVELGGNEKYKAVCWSCFQKLQKGLNR
jgi:thymidine kinase